METDGDSGTDPFSTNQTFSELTPSRLPLQPAIPISFAPVECLRQTIQNLVSIHSCQRRIAEPNDAV